MASRWTDARDLFRIDILAHADRRKAERMLSPADDHGAQEQTNATSWTGYGDESPFHRTHHRVLAQGKTFHMSYPWASARLTERHI